MAGTRHDGLSYFPEDEDQRLIEQAEKLVSQMDRLAQWVGNFAEDRREDPVARIKEEQQLDILKLARRARSLRTSSRLPVACAIYGPSQVGKSLLIGRVLRPLQSDQTALGYDEAYVDDSLSFEKHLNPRLGNNEATALVTRFTTADRMLGDGESIDPESPVMVRALNRSQWISVLARGFQIECQKSSTTWDTGTIEGLLDKLRADTALSADSSDSAWRSDLLSVYAYVQPNEPRAYPASAADLNALLARYSLSSAGYVRLVAELFWDGWENLTALFEQVLRFLEEIGPDARPEGTPATGEDVRIVVSWRAVKLLLSSFAPNDKDRGPRDPSWSDFRLARHNRDPWYTLRETGDRGWPTDCRQQDRETVQAAMLEMVVPVLPQRLNDHWRKILTQMDLLDVPGMKAGRAGPEGGKRQKHEVDDRKAQLEIVKRGKVAFLFERYTEEKLIQTLALLVRGGNLEVSGFIKDHVNKWGESRYEGRWPNRVTESPPALIIGMTGIDEEFRNEQPQVALYSARLQQLRDALEEVFDNFGGARFTNVYPLRYPGTWDLDVQRRAGQEEKWDQAGQAFLKCPEVRDYVERAEEKWNAAMEDDDGGVSLISDCLSSCTSAVGKRKQLQRSMEEVENTAAELARNWYQDAEPIEERARRAQHAAKTLRWLYRDREHVYYRVSALTTALTLRAETQAMYVADLKEKIAEEAMPNMDSLEERLRTELCQLLHVWATKLAPDEWQQWMNRESELHGQAELRAKLVPDEFGPDDFGALVRYLKDYLCSDKLREHLVFKLLPIVQLELPNNHAAASVARRRCVRLVLNDFLLNPGPSVCELPPVEGIELPAESEEGYGLMRRFLHRWRTRLPAVLVLGVSGAQAEPPGNHELGQILQDF